MLQLYVCVVVAMNNATDDSRRGELNGLAATVGSLAQVAGSTVCAALYAFSVDGDRSFPFNHHFAFYIIASVRFAGGYVAWNAIGVDGTGQSTPRPEKSAPQEIDGTTVENGVDSSVVSALHTCEKAETLSS